MTKDDLIAELRKAVCAFRLEDIESLIDYASEDVGMDALFRAAHPLPRVAYVDVYSFSGFSAETPAPKYTGKRITIEATLTNQAEREWGNHALPDRLMRAHRWVVAVGRAADVIPDEIWWRQAPKYLRDADFETDIVHHQAYCRFGCRLPEQVAA